MNNEESFTQERLNEIIQKFNKKRFEGLNLEDLAIGVQSFRFQTLFQKIVGQDWNKLYRLRAIERLNHANYDINWLTYKQDNEYNILFSLIEKNDFSKVQQFIQKKSKSLDLLNCLDSSQKSPLHIAAINGNTEMINFLLLIGYKRNSRDRTLKTPLHYSCLNGYFEASDLILNYKNKDEKNQINTDELLENQDSLGKNCFHYAVATKNTQLINFLIKKKRELIYSVDNSNLTPLHYVIYSVWENQIEVIRILIEKGANPNAQDIDGNTPLHCASSSGQLNALKCLILNGADIKIQDFINKKTPMQIAKSNKIRQAIVAASNSTIKNSISKNDQEMMSLSMQEKHSKPPNYLEEKQQQEFKKSLLIEQVPPKINPYEDNYSPVEQFVRGRFYKMMRNLQYEGATAWMHYKKLYLFTGTWFEKIETLEDLYNDVKDLQGSEVLIRCFNILCPYDKPLPKLSSNSDLEDMDKQWINFPGYKWYEGSGLLQRKKGQLDSLEEINEYSQKIKDLKIALEASYAQKDISDQELQKYKQLFEKNQNEFQQYKQRSEKLIQDSSEMIKIQNQKNQDKGQELTKKLNNLTETNKKQEEQIKIQQDKIIELQKELEEKNQQIKILEKKQSEIVSRNQKVIQEQQKEIVQVKEVQQVQIKIESKSVDQACENDALIQMYKNIYFSPPSFMQRMINADIDKDGKLNRGEFNYFCQMLKLSEDQIKWLMKAIKLSDKLSFNDIKNTCEDREAIDNIFQQRVFFKILAESKKRNISLADMFDKMNIKNADSLVPEQLKHGFSTMKIFLSDRDFNKIWRYFDKDANGKIKQSEFVETLKAFQQYSPSYTEITFQDRIGIDLFDNSLGIPSENDQQINATFMHLKESNIGFNEDTNSLNGDLQVQIPYAENLLQQEMLKQIYIRVLLHGSSSRKEADQYRSIIMFDSKNWDFSTKIPVRNVLRENINDGLIIQLYSEEEMLDLTFLGEVKVLWKPSIESPGQWYINHKMKLENVSYVKQNTKEVSGKIVVQCKWISSDSPEFTDKVETVNLLSLQSQEKFFNSTFLVDDGILECTVMASYLQKKEIKGKIRCLIGLPGQGNEKLYATLDARKNPQWGQKQTCKIKPKENPKENTKFDCIHVNVELDPGSLSQAILLGEVYINWSECIEWPGMYLTNKCFLFMDKSVPKSSAPCKLYVKTRWIPQFLQQKLTGFSQKSESEIKKELASDKDLLQKGILKVMIIRAMDLRPDDGTSADPYCVIKFDSHKQQIEKKTAVRGSTINPQWNEIFSFEILFLKELDPPPLQIEIKDRDKLSDDDLGTCIVDISAAIRKPCEWAVDQVFDIIDPKASKDAKPQIYLQVYFVPEGTPDPNIKPKEKGNSLIRDDKTATGTLIVRVVHARDIKIADSKASDPYSLILFPNNKEHKTSIISNTLNPIWKETFQEVMVLSLERINSGKAPVRVTLKDSDLMASDDVLGYTTVDWSSCIQKPGEWAVNNIFELQGEPNIKGNLKTLGFIYLQMKFLEEGRVDDGQSAIEVENLANILALKGGTYQGTLRIFLVHCEGLVKADDGDKDFSDPYCIFKIPGGRQIKSSVKKETLNPIWEIIYTSAVTMPMNTIQPMRVEVSDDDLLGSDLLGYVNINLEPCLKDPQKWAINKQFSLDGSQEMRQKYNRKDQDMGKIYLQIMFVQEGVKCDDPTLPLEKDLNQQLHQQNVENKQPMKGILTIFIPMARGLIIADSMSNSSDPYVEIIFPDGKKRTTKTIEKTLNPIWNYQDKYRIDLLKEEYKPIHFIVKDQDTGAIDDTLGEVKVEWMELFNNPLLWNVNKIFKLEGKQVKGQSLGEIYIQMKFISDQYINQQAKDSQILSENDYPPTIPDLDIFTVFGRIIGVIDIDIISATELPNMDTIGKSDPYVICYLSNEPQTKQKTEIKNDCSEPVWDFKGKIFVDLFRCQVIKNSDIVFEIYDQDNISDELMGVVKVPLLDILEKELQQISLDQDLTDPNKQDGQQISKLGSLKLGFKWIPSKFSESITNPYIRMPEKIYKGKIFFKILNCKQLRDKYKVFVESCLSIGGQSKKKEKLITKTEKLIASSDPNIEQSFIIDVDIGERSYATLKLQLEIKDKGLMIDDTIGGCTIALKNLLDQAGTWYNEYTPIIKKDGNTDIHKDKDGKELVSYIGLQIQYRNADEQNIDTTEPELDWKKFITAGVPPTNPGVLYVKVVGARKIPTSILDKSDPFAQIKLNKGKQEPKITHRLDDNLNPIWNFDCEFPLDLTDKDWEFLQLQCAVYDWDFASNDLLGKVDIDISQLLNNNGQWMDQIFPLLNENDTPGAGELYLQIQFRPKDLKVEPFKGLNQFQKEEQQQKLQEEEREKEIQKKAQEPTVKGKLVLHIIEASSLIKADDFSESDGMVQIKFSKGTKETIITPVIDNNKNPVWNFEKIIDMEIKQSEFSDIKIIATVLDQDDLGANQFLGYIEIILDQYMTELKGKWMNQLYQLCNESGVVGKNGILSVQIQWRQENDIIQDLNPPTPLLIQDFYKGKTNPIGKFLIYVVQALNVMSKTKDGSDGLLKIKLGSKQNKTTRAKTSKNPQWNQVLELDSNFDNPGMLPLLYCELFHDKTFGSDFLGEFEVNMQAALEKPMTWAISEKYPVTDFSKRGPSNKNDLTGEVELKIGFVPKNSSVEALKQCI